MKKSKYLVEYKVGNNQYNYILKAKSDEDVLAKFDKVWIEKFGPMYPFQNYQITQVIKIIDKLRNY
jgi:hypothetical protein